jgi:glutaredoxin
MLALLESGSLTCAEVILAARSQLVLYTRPGCHLCDLAAAMLDRQGLAWRPVDIEGDTSLLERYGSSVPVIRCPDTGDELFFPFDEEGIRQWSDTLA